MKTYKIPVVWQNWGLVEVKADNLEQAKELVLKGSLPEGYYIDNSFEIDEDGIDSNNTFETKE